MIVKETNTGIFYDAIENNDGTMMLHRLKRDKDCKKCSREEVNDNFVFYDVAKPNDDNTVISDEYLKLTDKNLELASRLSEYKQRYEALQKAFDEQKELWKKRKTEYREHSDEAEKKLRFKNDVAVSRDDQIRVLISCVNAMECEKRILLNRLYGLELKVDNNDNT